MSGLEVTGIILIVLLGWYLLMMILAIVFGKMYSKTGSTAYKTSARIFKMASILNYPFKKLDEASIHIDAPEKVRNVVRTGVGNWARGIGEDMINKANAEQIRGGDYIPEAPGF